MLGPEVSDLVPNEIRKERQDSVAAFHLEKQAVEDHVLRKYRRRILVEVGGVRLAQGVPAYGLSLPGVGQHDARWQGHNTGTGM